MFVKTLVRVILPVSLLAVCAGAALVVAGAPAAGAASAFNPALAASPAADKWLDSEPAPYTATLAVKRVATVKRARKAPAATRTTTTTTRKSGGSELSRAQSILAAQIRKHPILKGTTVEIGDARGYQAICYYRSGRIVVSRTHKASLDRILAHEVWHVIDWRDNGRIDWGERVPR